MEELWECTETHGIPLDVDTSAWKHLHPTANACFLHAQLCSVTGLTLPHVLAQDLVVYCNATQNQYYGDSGVPFNTAVFAPGTPETAATTDNAINCCLRCAFSNTCNIWCALPLSTLLSSTEDLPAFL